MCLVSFCDNTDGELYSGTAADFMGRDFAIFRTLGHHHPIRTEQHDSRWLNGRLDVHAHRHRTQPIVTNRFPFAGHTATRDSVGCWDNGDDLTTVGVRKLGKQKGRLKTEEIVALCQMWRFSGVGSGKKGSGLKGGREAVEKIPSSGVTTTKLRAVALFLHSFAHCFESIIPSLDVKTALIQTSKQKATPTSFYRQGNEDLHTPNSV